MKAGTLFLLLGLTSLTGCVTTNSGDFSAGASVEDAAALNLDLGIGYLRQGDFEQAITKLRKSIDEDPNNPTAHRALGLAYEEMDDKKGAEEEYRTAVRLGSDDADALNQLASFLCANGDKQEALQLYDRAIEVPLYPNKAMLYANAGTCAKESDLDLAENYLRNALAIQSDYAVALLQMAEVAYRKENYLQAQAFLERYAGASSYTPASLWLTYRVEIAMKDPASARNTAARLVREFPESIETRLLLEEQRDAG